MNLISTSAMNTQRTLHSATRLGGSGLVLIAGGLDENSNPLASAELYNPATGVFTTIENALNTARYGHTAIQHAAGAIFIIAGLSGIGAYLSSIEIFVPGANPVVTGVFTPAASGLSSARAGMRAQLLPDGRFLITGGNDGSDVALDLAEIYSPGI